METLSRIKVRVIQNFENFYIETLIQIHSLDDAKNLQNFVVSSLLSFVTFQLVDIDK